MVWLRNVLLGLATIVAVFFLGRYSVSHEQSLVHSAVTEITTAANKQLKETLKTSADVLADTFDARMQQSVSDYKGSLKNVQDNFDSLQRLTNPSLLVKSDTTNCPANSTHPAGNGGQSTTSTGTYRARLADESVSFLTRSASDADACAVYYNQLMDRYTSLLAKVRAYNRLNAANPIKID